MRFVRSPAFDSPTEVFAWLIEQGCSLHGCRVFREQGEWRGSGRIHPEAEQEGGESQ